MLKTTKTAAKTARAATTHDNRRRCRINIAAAALGGAATLQALTHPPATADDAHASLTQSRHHTDALFEQAKYHALADALKKSLAHAPDDAQLLWRLARALVKLADAAPDKKAKEPLLRESLSAAERAVGLQPDCAPANKWLGISLSKCSSFEGTKETIKKSFSVRDRFERACALDPADATSRHLLGLWCFEVASLSWLEQKAASALFATPPSATHEEAYAHFLAAERIDPGFYPKNHLLLARSCDKLGKEEEARMWRAHCLAQEVRSPEDEETLRQAAELKL